MENLIDTLMDRGIFPDRRVELSFHTLLDTYPTALPLIKRNLKGEIKRLRERIEILRIRGEANHKDLPFCEELIQEKLRRLKEVKMQLSFLTPRPDSSSSRISTHDIMRAKQRPIKDFIKVNSGGKAVCLFHTDKNASMHVYPSNYYCFSCSSSGTVVDIIMKLRNCTFREAVLYLTNK